MVGGAGAAVGEDGALCDGVGVAELGPGMAGNGGTAVWVLIAPLASTSAMDSPTASSTAVPAAIHNQRGDFGPSGGGGVSPPGGGPPAGGWSCCQYGGKGVVGLVSFRPGVHCGAYPPYLGA